MFLFVCGLRFWFGISCICFCLLYICICGKCFRSGTWCTHQYNQVNTFPFVLVAAMLPNVSRCCPMFLNVAQCFSKLPLRSNKPGKRKLMAPKQSQLKNLKGVGFCIFCMLWERENATKRNLLFWSTCLPRGNELCRIEKSSEIQSFATKKSSLTGNWFCFPICGNGFESREETSFAESLLWKKSK